jgi:hypothetical protein
MLEPHIPEEVAAFTPGWVRWLGARTPSHRGPVRLRVRPIKRGRDGSTPSGSTAKILLAATYAKGSPRHSRQQRHPIDPRSEVALPCIGVMEQRGQFAVLAVGPAPCRVDGWRGQVAK